MRIIDSSYQKRKRWGQCSAESLKFSTQTKSDSDVGFEVISVARMHKKINGTRIEMPLILEQPVTLVQNRNMFHLRKLGNMFIKVDPHKTKTNILQCHRCQEFARAAQQSRSVQQTRSTQQPDPHNNSCQIFHAKFCHGCSSTFEVHPFVGRLLFRLDLFT